MKYTQILNQNMVPEWRNQYLDYKALNSALHKALENKHLKWGSKGIDSYFELIKFNQKFADYFSRECQVQLDKINSFHKEKLNEVNGKYKNLQDQLDQVLTSALYRQIQPDLSAIKRQQQQESTCNSNVTSITSISELFRSLKNKVGTHNDYICNNQLTQAQFNADQQLDHPGLSCHQVGRINTENADRRLSDGSNTSASSSSSKESKAVSVLVRKLSEGFSTSAQRLTQLNLSLADQHFQPIKLNGRALRNSISKTFDVSRGSSSVSLDPSLQHQHHYQQAVTTTSSLTKKKIIASYKKKLSNLKFAFRELYFNLVVFEQYTQLNYSGFEQILRKHDRMFASTLGRKFYQEHVQTADFYNNLHQIDNLIEGVEHIYTLHFENGNRRKAIQKLQVPNDVYKPSSPQLDFRVGFELGMFAILFVLVLVIGFVSDTDFDWRTVFRLYRTPLILIIFLFQAAISILIWKHYKINHVLIFELDPRDNLSFHYFLELGSLLGIIWSISVLLFLLSERLDLIPSVCPIVVIAVIATYLFNPTATCSHQSRFWLLRKLGRVITAPFQPVRFADFWIADQLVSIVPLFLDLEYLSCFYTTGDVLSASHLSSDFASRCVTRNPQDLVIRTIVAALPAWFRCAQCLRRWRDENWLRLHLANAGKYWCMCSVVFLSSISQYNKTSFELDTMRIIWIVAAIFTSSLTAYWDIIYDFGLFSKYDKDDGDKETTNNSKKSSTHSNSSSSSSTSSNNIYIQKDKKKKKIYPYLRKELVYPVWVYYFAIVENWILRFGWIITISLTEFSNIEAELVVSLLAPLEMFRRFVWNCIRLENEQLNNCGLFRAVRDIPIEVVAPIDESHLDKVIMMMDSRDGPAMRKRLTRRRNLRQDRVSYMALHPPDIYEPSHSISESISESSS